MTEAVTGLDLVELQARVWRAELWICISLSLNAHPPTPSHPRAQLRVAAGERLADLGLRQADLAPAGHAFEARLYAERPGAGFLPAGGRVRRWRPPPGAAAFAPRFGQPGGATGGAGGGAGAALAEPFGAGCAVRVDSGVATGDLVGVEYDPMIAKVVARWALGAWSLGGRVVAFRYRVCVAHLSSV